MTRGTMCSRRIEAHHETRYLHDLNEWSTDRLAIQHCYCGCHGNFHWPSNNVVVQTFAQLLSGHLVLIDLFGLTFKFGFANYLV